MSELPVTAASGPTPVPPPVNTKACVICAARIHIDAMKCTTCDCWQVGKACLVCGTWIAKSAARCGECKSFQNWRRVIPGNEVVLALLVSLFSVLSTAIPAILYVLRLPSNTTAIVLDPEFDRNIAQTKRVLIVRAFNGGGSSSIVRGAKLDLSKVRAATVELANQTPRQSEVPAFKQTDVKFFAQVIRPAAGATAGTVAHLLCSQPVSLLLYVDEQTRFGRFVPRTEPLRVSVAGRRIRPWVLDKMTIEEKPCE
jgi:hypothetical protein